MPWVGGCCLRKSPNPHQAWLGLRRYGQKRSTRHWSDGSARLNQWVTGLNEVSTLQRANCPNCQTPFTDQKVKIIGRWDRSPGGDDYFDDFHCCPSCDTWWIVTFVDRFAGPEEVRIRGPLSDDEIKAPREGIST